ncbi:hypothetical protein [Tellurirhabdus rosea]|uniref:hypothetical protein n=1 Tax=Tellurirhabdus rosea TaxID=2674997 RepID=UPI00224E160D|nr:hypothetical protein [Tellurirhabdus rosea]
MKATYLFLLLGTLFLAACEHEKDPFVDRTAAPVLLVFENAIGDGGGQTTEPTVTSKATGPATLRIRVYELDKTNILDHAQGIDSLPVASLTMKLTTRTGTAIADLTTDAKGIATLSRPWSDFGITAPKVGTNVALVLSGKHKDQSFSKLARLQAN